MSFHLLDPKAPSVPRDGDALVARPLLPTLSDLRDSAHLYRPSPDLISAVNVALAVNAPLLITGEPGTGKTQVAFYLAWYFSLGRDAVKALHVRSSTVAQDLLYRFDAVRYFHAAHQAGGEVHSRTYVTPGPLWQAFTAKGRAVVLIDEVDKAPRDFPNDLLNVIDQNRFKVPEYDDAVIELGEGERPPIVVITTNSERRLPEPFLRRCVFHHIKMTPELLEEAVQARKDAGAYPNLSQGTVEAALDHAEALRDNPVLRKKPATSEVLLWLAALNAMGGVELTAEQAARDLPALSVLIKDSDDLAAL